MADNAKVCLRHVVELRPYSHQDQGALVDLWYESWRSIGLGEPVVTKGDLAERVPNDLATRWTVTMAVEGDHLLGFLALALGEQRLDQLFVAPGAQGGGVGSKLFEEAVRRLPNGFWLTTQPSNKRARRFYERRGMYVDRTERGLGGDRVFYVMPSGNR